MVIWVRDCTCSGDGGLDCSRSNVSYRFWIYFCDRTIGISCLIGCWEEQSGMMSGFLSWAMEGWNCHGLEEEGNKGGGSARHCFWYVKLKVSIWFAWGSVSRHLVMREWSWGRGLPSCRHTLGRHLHIEKFVFKTPRWDEMLHVDRGEEPGQTVGNLTGRDWGEEEEAAKLTEKEHPVR